MFYQFFLSSQQKQSVIISNKDGRYEVPHKLPDDLERNLRTFKYQRIIAQCQVFLQKQKCFQYQQKTREIQKLNFPLSALFIMKTRICLKRFFRGCPQRQFFVSNLPQSRSKQISLTVLVNVRSLTQFQLEGRATKLQKSAKICLT